MDTERAREILAESAADTRSKSHRNPVLSQLARFFQQKQVTLPDLIEFTETLHALYRAGFTIQSSLSILDENITHPTLKKTMQEIAASIQAGNTLSGALSEHSGIFPRFYINSIRAAEEGGIVEVMLDHLSDYLKRDYHRSQLIQRWFFYPNLVFKLIIAGALLLAVIHGMVTTNLRNVVLVGILVCGWYLGKDVVRAIASRGMGKRIWDTIQLHAPMVKSFYRTLLNYQFASQFLPMYNAGVRIDRIFELLGEASRNRRYGSTLQTIAYQLSGGETLPNAIAKTPYITGHLRVHFRTGAKSGNYNHSIQAFLGEQKRKLPGLIRSRARMVYMMYFIVLLYLLMQMVNIFVGGYFRAFFPG